MARSGRPKDNYIWKGYEGLTQAELAILQVLEKHTINSLRGLRLKDIARMTGYHPVSISHLLNHLASRNLVYRNRHGDWFLKKGLKERIILEVSSSFMQDLDIKALKEGKTIQEYILQKLEEAVYYQ